MDFYFAPMEGITGYAYRNAHFEQFPGLSAYYAPFVSPGPDLTFGIRKMTDLAPERQSAELFLVPQILSNVPDLYVQTAARIATLGYKKINLNLGCPSGTVVSKGRGAAMLRDPESLDAFLQAVSRELPDDLTFSIKTRIGFDDVKEWNELLPVFIKNAPDELIIHPRIRSEYYKGRVHTDAFLQAMDAFALSGAATRLVYNGDIFTKADYDLLLEQFSHHDQRNLQAVMLGRGLLANPALARELAGGAPLSREEFKAFHKGYIRATKEALVDEKPILFRLKEMWFYWSTLYENPSKVLKIVRKSGSLAEYQALITGILQEDVHPEQVRMES